MGTPRIEMTSRRKAAGLSALALGMAAGISEMRVYAIERGRCVPGHEEAAAIARVLGVRPELVFPELKKAAR